MRQSAAQGFCLPVSSVPSRHWPPQPVCGAFAPTVRRHIGPSFHDTSFQPLPPNRVTSEKQTAANTPISALKPRLGMNDPPIPVIHPTKNTAANTTAPYMSDCLFIGRHHPAGTSTSGNANTLVSATKDSCCDNNTWSTVAPDAHCYKGDRTPNELPFCRDATCREKTLSLRRSGKLIIGGKQRAKDRCKQLE